ncbi:MAG: metallophosphoesterase [Sphingomonadales bacterium]|nr:metallophosphoesterase [Sphingomonadales bacterium]
MRWIFLLIVLLFWLGIDLYFYQAIKTVFKGKQNNLISRIYIGLCVLLYALIGVSITLNGAPAALNYRNLIVSVLFIGFIIRLLALPWLILDDLRRLLIWIKKAISQQIFTRKSFRSDTSTRPKATFADATETGKGITRSEFLSKGAIITAGIPLVGLVYGAVRGAYAYTLHRVTLSFPNLPPSFDGFTLVQLSDMHLGSFGSHRDVERGLKMAMDTAPDCVVFTGDLVNNRSDEALPWLSLLKQIRAPHGVYSILGNHDYGDYQQWDSPQAKLDNMSLMHKIQADAGWNLMRNEHRLLEKNNERIVLIGVDNWGSGRRFSQYGDLAEAVKGICDDSFQILLSHDPSHFEEVVRKNFPQIDLTLSGHTHGMQAGIEIPGVVKWSPSSWVYPHWAGLYTFGRQYLYVNRGFGFLGYPGRLGIWPEITHITLKKIYKLP